VLLLTLFTEEEKKTKFLPKLQHMDKTLLALFCSNMAAEIAKLPL